MRRKGFTLIELLAVLVVLGLLMAIAVPAVSKYVTQSKKKTYSFLEEDMRAAAANMMSECIKNNEGNCVPDSGDTKVVYLNELIGSQYSEAIKDPEGNDDNILCDGNNSYVVIKNGDDNLVNLDYQVCLVCSKYKSGACEATTPGVCDLASDHTKPECGSVTGASTLWTNQDRYISVGCSDEGCGCSRGTFSKMFNTSTRDATINVTDKSGNVTACPVNVYVDKEAPSCTLEVVGTTGENGWYYGNTIVRLKTKTDALSGIASYGMGTSSINYDFNKLNEYQAPAGISTIYGYVKDEAGNVGKCQVEVKNDNVVPVQVVNYGYQVYPKEDMTSTNNGLINIGNYLNEYGNIKGIKIYFNNNTNTITNSTVKSGSTILATRTIAAGVNYMEYTFTNGTYNNLSIDLKSAANVSKVTKVEVIKDQITTGFYTNSDVTIYVNSKDAISGNGYYSYDGGTTWVNNSSNTVSNNKSFRIVTKDIAGNMSAVVNANVNNIDKLLPSCSLTTSNTPNAAGWFKTNAEIKFNTHVDAAATSGYAMSGVRDYSFNPNGIGNPKTKSQGNTPAAGISNTGYIIDKAGNKNSCAIAVKVDTVIPVVNVTAKMKGNGMTVASGTIAGDGLNFTFTKGNVGNSGYKIYYCKDTNNTCTPTTEVASGTTITAYNELEGEYYIRYKIESGAGLSSTGSYKANVQTVLECTLVATASGVKFGSMTGAVYGGLKFSGNPYTPSSSVGEDGSIALSIGKYTGTVWGSSGRTEKCEITVTEPNFIVARGRCTNYDPANGGCPPAETVASFYIESGCYGGCRSDLQICSGDNHLEDDGSITNTGKICRPVLDEDVGKYLTASGNIVDATTKSQMESLCLTNPSACTTYTLITKGIDGYTKIDGTNYYVKGN